MYVPGNIVVAAAATSTTTSCSACSSRPSRRSESPGTGRRVRSPLVKPPPPDLRFMRKDTEQYHPALAAPGIARSDRRRFAASLLDAILGGSASSRLFQEIREKRGWSVAVYTFASQYTDTGQIGLYVGTREENLGPASRSRRNRSRKSLPATCGRTSSSGPRRT